MIADIPAIGALVTDWNAVPVEKTYEGIERQTIVGKNMIVCRFRFAPYLVTDEHSHPHEQMTLIIRGRVKFIISGEERILSAGDVCHFPPYKRHGATMLDEEVIMIDIFSLNARIF